MSATRKAGWPKGRRQTAEHRAAIARSKIARADNEGRIVRSAAKSSYRYPEKFVHKICALRGVQSAAMIAERNGLTRGAVIGIWNRHRPREVA